MMGRGVYLPCSQFEAAFTCAAMNDEHIDQTIQAAAESLRALAKA
jgi:glutamate-1-semialdehyde 2,1-aminomutase